MPSIPTTSTFSPTANVSSKMRLTPVKKSLMSGRAPRPKAALKRPIIHTNVFTGTNRLRLARVAAAKAINPVVLAIRLCSVFWRSGRG
jgi:hypothetical protein